LLLGESVVHEHESTIGAEPSRTRAREWTKLKPNETDLQDHLRRRNTETAMEQADAGKLWSSSLKDRVRNSLRRSKQKGVEPEVAKS